MAERLGWRLLDSGALYRAVGYAAGMAGLDLSDVEAVTRCAQTHEDPFPAQSQTAARRGSSSMGTMPPTNCARKRPVRRLRRSRRCPSVRQALVAMQLGFRKAPGLVADGRDMGTVIFPDAAVQGLPHRQRRRAREKTL